MKFLNPAGLWLLLGVPVLILIYLIRAQHEDRPVSSTYIWKLSHRFMKNRLPMQKIRKVLIFLMQLAMVVIVALLAARPAVVNAERCDYIVILDASASMQSRDDKGVTRFDYALREIEEFADRVSGGHTLSIILASDDASFLLQESTSRSEVKMALEKVSCTNGGCNVEEAISLAQLLCDESENAQVIFYTDTEYSETKNVHVENLNRNEWNVSLKSLVARQEGLDTVFTGTLASYNLPCQVTVGLRIDDKVVDARTVSCDQGGEAEFSFTAEELFSYDTAQIFIEEEDALESDNSYVLCKKSDRTYNVLLVSPSPLYLKTALEALDSCDVAVVSSLAKAELSGYDLYVFDGVAPEEYPTDGSVLLFGTENLPEGLKASYGSEDAYELTVKRGAQSQIFDDLALHSTMVKNFSALTGSPAWEKLLFCGDDAVMATRRLESGMHFSVISFDLHDSNLPIQSSFAVLMRNLVEYSVPHLVRETDYTFGDTVNLTVMPTVEKLYAVLPDGSVSSLSFTGQHSAIQADALGVYTVVTKTGEEGEYADFFVHIPYEENAAKSDVVLEIRLAERVALTEYDAVSEIWFWVSLAMLLILLAEWGWYYREQF